MAPSPDGALAGLLLLADGRFPAGGYAHSGGLEPAVIETRVRDFADFEEFLAATIETTAALAAGFAAAACVAVRSRDEARLCALDAGLDARMPSPAQRATSRLLGRQLLRAAGAISADDRLELVGRDPHRPLAIGAVAATLGLPPRAAALAMLHEVAAGVVAAAIRLLGLDPLAAYATLARARPRLDALAAAAAQAADGDVDLLPAPATPMLDLYAERHARRTARLFSS